MRGPGRSAVETSEQFPSGAIRVPGMIMLGSAGRNSGKTTFACRLIESLQSRRRVIGLKIATIRGTGDRCVRGRTDCNVCSSLTAPFELVDDADCRDGGGGGEKDTHRMAAAGAHGVYWLRSRPEALRDAIEAFAERLEPGDLVICESNSLREVVVPDLFLIFRSAGSGPMKPTARKAARFADATVTFENGDFDLGPEDIVVVRSRFMLRRRNPALLLAGGASVRMGTDKRYLEIDGEPLITRIYNDLRVVFETVYVAANDLPEGIGESSVIPDSIPGTGPIGGIISGLEASGSGPLFVLACDIPGVDPALLGALYRALPGKDISVPMAANGRYETLFGLYDPAILPEILHMVEAGEYRIRMVYDRVGTVAVPVPDFYVPDNINTRSDYERVTRRGDDVR